MLLSMYPVYPVTGRPTKYTHAIWFALFAFPAMLLLTIWCSRDDFRDVVISVPPGVELISQGIDDTSASSPDDSGTTLYRLRLRVGERSFYVKRDGEYQPSFTIEVAEERETQRFEWSEAESGSH